MTLSPSDLARLRRAVRHDGAVKPAARLLFEDICDLAARTGTCTASPRHFANVYDVSEKTVERWAKDLERAGYLERPSAQRDARRKGYTPSFPSVRVEIRDETVPQIREMGDEKLPQIGDDSRPAPRVYTPPRGGEGARAHEGTLAREAQPGFDPVGQYAEAFPDVEPNTFQLSQLRSCTDPRAFSAALTLWLGNDHVGRHIANFVDRYRRIAAGEDGADGRLVSRPAIPGRAGVTTGGRMRDLADEVL